jgi:hypothetical protein
VSRVFGDLVPQRANGHSKHTRRRGTIPAGAGERLDHKIAFDISDGKADQPSRQTAAGGIGYRQLRVGSHAQYSTVRTILNPAPEDKNEVNKFLTGALNLELRKKGDAACRPHSYARHFNESSLRTQGPQRERDCAHRGGAESRFGTGAEAFFHF